MDRFDVAPCMTLLPCEAPILGVLVLVEEDLLLEAIVLETLGVAAEVACCRIAPGTSFEAIPAACVDALCVAGLKLQAAQT